MRKKKKEGEEEEGEEKKEKEEKEDDCDDDYDDDDDRSYVLDMVRQQLKEVEGARIKTIQFIDRNTIHGTRV